MNIKNVQGANYYYLFVNFIKIVQNGTAYTDFARNVLSERIVELIKKTPEKKRKKVRDYQRKMGFPSKYKPYNPKYYSSEQSKTKKRARDLKRRVLKHNAALEYEITDSTINKIKAKYENKCAYCGKDCAREYHIDHKLPLSRGGGNDINNLALSCPTCNWKKNNKTDIEFIGHTV